MANKTFYIWATLLSDRAANDLVAGLVRMGFSTEPLASDDALTIKSDVSTICSIKVVADHVPEKLPNGDPPQRWVLARVKEVLAASKDLYYSLIVLEYGGSCTWDGSNIKLPKKPEPVKTDEPVEEPKTPTAIDKMDEALDT